MHKITGVKVLEPYRLELVFADGVRSIVDLSDLVGKGVFALWDDYQTFEQVRIGSSGELVWSGQIDLCPDALYLRATGKQRRRRKSVRSGPDRTARERASSRNEP